MSSFLGQNEEVQGIRIILFFIKSLPLVTFFILQLVGEWREERRK